MLSYHATCSKAEVDRLKVTSHKKHNQQQPHCYHPLTVFV